MDGVPVKLEGNPLCPVARGRLCAKGQAALEAYFDPDRLIGPARRDGPRGSNRWTRISWSDAVAEFASRLDRARSTSGRIVAIGADERGPIDDAWSRFWRALPADVAWTALPTAERLAPRFRALTGAVGDPVFDLEHATHVISFGAPIVEDWLSPVWVQRSYGRFRRGIGRPRGRLVQIEGRRSMTARKADEWLPVAADKQVALAYGLASVLLREDRVDRTVLAALGGNLAAFESDLVARYTPDNVAVASGVPVVTLLRLARDLAATPQPLAVVAADAAPALVDAVFALNALIGALDRPGGILEAPNGAPRSERANAAAALASLPSGDSSVVVLRDAAPFRSLATSFGVADFERVGFVVSLSPYLDESTAAADLVLPTHTPLESWHGMIPCSADGSEKVATASPAATPRLETRDLVELLRSTAEKLALDVESAAPFASSAEAVGAELERLSKLRRGVPYTTGFESNWALQLERGGWWVAAASSGDEFARVALAAGGWVDPYVAFGRLRGDIATRGGLTFVPPAAAAPLVQRDEAAAGVVRASLDRAIDDARPPGEWPLRLAAFTPAVVNTFGSLNQPALFELLGQPDSAPWQVWAEIGPETAREHGIAHGASIRITSPSGSIDAMAIVVERMPSGTVAAAFVPAQRNGGRWARLVTSDVRRLWGRRTPSEAVAVRITKL
jgi:anaerobic selenocysteine-containing dehydrogenase